MALADISTTLDAIERALRSGDAIHRLNPPIPVVDADVPVAVAEMLRRFDGGALFHDTILLCQASELRRVEDCYLVGTLDSDDIRISCSGVVFLGALDDGCDVVEGAAFDRWLLGVVEAQMALYDRDGEFKGDLFDEHGEMLPEASAAYERYILKRDKKAVGPRWRLASALARMGNDPAARDHLERALEEQPEFAWGWFDLARASERLGDHETAVEDYAAAADAQPKGPFAGVFLAHAARLAVRLGDEARRAAWAKRACEGRPDLVAGQFRGAQEQASSGALADAKELVDVVLALSPNHLGAAALSRELMKAMESMGDASRR